MAKQVADPAVALLKMLAFQYQPLEKALQKMVKPEDWKMYQKLPAMKKIVVLDNMALTFGL